MLTLLKKFSFYAWFLAFVVLIDHPLVWAVDADVSIPTTLLQSEFKNFSEEVGLAISYLPLSPAEPLGILGFDVGVEATVIDIREDRPYWTKTAPDAPGFLILPKLHVQKGLPFGFDIGAVYTKVPKSNIAMAGGEIKWALLSGNAVLPAIALRGSYTKLLGVNDLDLYTVGTDLSISKGFTFVTPYAGIGQVWVKSKEKVGALNLNEVSLTLPKGFIGVKISLLLINFVAEVDFAKVPMYTGRLNIGF